MRRPSIFRIIRELLLPLAGLVLLIGACTDNLAPTSTPGFAKVHPDCAIDCFCCDQGDPHPSAPGVWLDGITPSECFKSLGSTGVDADGDGLEDYCEEIIAPEFAPQLHYYSGDDVRGEPHWAARPDSSNQIVIAYLLSYYYDLGSFPFYVACNVPPFSLLHACWGHFGDSEMLVLTVYYNYTTQHWILGRAVFSQHDGFVTYDKGLNADPTQLTYPAHAGTYPLVWVAEGKHSNYSNKSECDAGGFVDGDTCDEVNASVRVATWGAYGSLNIGSSAHHTSSQDCMQSANPSFEYYGGGRIECYWSTTYPYDRFRGWIPDWVPLPSQYTSDTDPYGPKLLSWGF